MDTLRSYIAGAWHTASDGFAPLVDPSTEAVLGQVSSHGVDFGAALDTARRQGGPALRALTFAERGAALKAISKAWREHRDELLQLSQRHHGTTAADGSFDIDGAGGTLAYYASLAKGLGDRRALSVDEGVQLGKTEGFWSRHARVPRHGVAVAINAFNFPVWGFAEKAACALLAGMPMIVKPATATAAVAARALEIAIESGALPDGALQCVIGSAGDLVDRLGPQDVLAFTGSADTAMRLRGKANLLEASVSVNVEADSLNAAVLAPGVDPESATFALYVRDVVREMTQKAGQKCTAVRRLIVPAAVIDAVAEALTAKLSKVQVGDPADESVTMGPLASAAQLADAVDGVAALEASGATRIHGSGQRIDGIGAPAGKGFFFGPTLLRHDDAHGAGDVHRREVFGPVATLLPYDGTAAEAASIVALGGGTLVTSVYGDDAAWHGDFLADVGAHTGRVYLGSEGSAKVAFGSGAALPQAHHGGPGRAGGGGELGGLQGLELYTQRVAIQGDRALVDPLIG